MKLDTVYLMKHVEIPISIVECGFLSNPEEEQQLLNDEYQDKLAWGIYNGIIDYFYILGKSSWNDRLSVERQFAFYLIKWYNKKEKPKKWRN